MAGELVVDRERRLVLAEYREMPGLCLTPPQMRRLWHFDATTCAAVLSDLVTAGFLRRRQDGAYVRTSGMRRQTDAPTLRSGRKVSSSDHHVQ